MILVDTGPLVALLDADDAAHALCVRAAQQLTETRLLTTWPCFVEAMYLLGRIDGIQTQDYLWRLRGTRQLELYAMTEDDESRAEALMVKYADLPMDLADASLVVAAEALGLKEIFTLDSDFRIYRLRDGAALTLIP